MRISPCPQLGLGPMGKLAGSIGPTLGCIAFCASCAATARHMHAPPMHGDIEAHTVHAHLDLAFFCDEDIFAVPVTLGCEHVQHACHQHLVT